SGIAETNLEHAFQHRFAPDRRLLAPGIVEHEIVRVQGDGFLHLALVHQVAKSDEGFLACPHNRMLFSGPDLAERMIAQFKHRIPFAVLWGPRPGRTEKSAS